MSEQFADAGGRYRLVDRIATGGMGVVWRGWDTVLDRDVAVKILKAEFADDQGFRARFAEEARHAAALHHPHIAALFDTGESPATDVYPPRPFLVMELVEGQPLNQLIRPGAPMAPDVVADLMAQAADALGAAHRAGIVHRDVKPGNLLVTPARQVKITDFGIARAAESVALTRTGQVMGTPQYLSPEQATGEQATPASDVYSLGCVAYECLAGRRPFDAETSVATALAHVRDEVPPLPAVVPEDLARVVMRSLSKKPGDRFTDGTAFAAALRDPAAAVASTPAAPAAPATSLVTQAMAPVPVAAPGTQVLDTVQGPSEAAGAVGAATAPGGRRRLEDEEERSSNALWWWLTGLLALALLVGVLVWQVSGGGGGSEPADDPTQSPSVPVRPTPSDEATQDTGIDLDASRYVGRQFAEVSAELIARDLRVKRDERPNPGSQTPGQVTGLNPTGRVEAGDVITVSFWGPVREAPSEEPSETPSRTPSPEPSKEPSQEPSTPVSTPTPTPTQTPSAPPTETASSSPEAAVETQ